MVEHLPSAHKPLGSTLGPGRKRVKDSSQMKSKQILPYK
jgi:hypothetical protein